MKSCHSILSPSITNLFSTFLLMSILFLCISATPATQPASTSFDLVVKLNDPYIPDLTFTTIIRLNEPFAVKVADSKSTSAIWGQLRPENDGKYPLVLTIYEWAAPGMASKVTETHKLKLGESYSEGGNRGDLFKRTITLTSHEQ